MSRESLTRPTKNDARISNDVESENEAQASDAAKKAAISVPGDLDGSIKDEVVPDQKSQIVEIGAPGEILKEGARLLRRGSGRGKGPLHGEEVNQDAAAGKIQQALPTKRGDMSRGQRKRAKRPVSSSCEHPTASETATISNGSPGDSRKKPKNRLDARSPTKTRGNVVPRLHVSHPEISIVGTERLPASGGTASSAAPLVSSANVQRIVATSTTRSTTASVQPTVTSLISDILHHLSSAVSAAGLLTYLHSIEIASNRYAPAAYDAIAAAVEHLTGSASNQHLGIPSSNNAWLAQPSLSAVAGMAAQSHLQSGNRNIEQPLHHGVPAAAASIPNQELLRAAMLVMQSAGASMDTNNADWHQYEGYVQSINMLLQACQQNPPPPDRDSDII
jgi:hypothetical protein